MQGGEIKFCDYLVKNRSQLSSFNNMKRKREDTQDVQLASSPSVVPWTSLPSEVWLSILSLLPTPALISVSRTCRSLRDLGQDPGLWTRVSLDWQSIKNKSQ